MIHVSTNVKGGEDDMTRGHDQKSQQLLDLANNCILGKLSSWQILGYFNRLLKYLYITRA
jgi:hypothetical protein